MKTFVYNDMEFQFDKGGNGWNISRTLPNGSVAVVGAGLFADAHRAIGDCCALLHILSTPFGAEGKPALATLLANARKATIRIFAVDSPFDRKDLLKTRGYRWSNGMNGCRRCWWRDVTDRDLEAELAFLRASVFLRPVDLPTQRITARERYSTNPLG